MPPEGEHKRLPLPRHELLQHIMAGTAAEIGTDFFPALVQSLADVLNVKAAWVTEYIPGPRRLRAIAFWMGGEWHSDKEYDIADTPCEKVIVDCELFHVPRRIRELFPGDNDLHEHQIESFLGVPLLDIDGRVLGHLAVMDTAPLPEEELLYELVQIFGARAAAEHRRLRAESETREREEKLSSLVDSAMDAIVEMDEAFTITRVNPAGERVFGGSSSALTGSNLAEHLDPDSMQRMVQLSGKLATLPLGRRFVWIPGGLHAQRRGSEEFIAEASLSEYLVHDAICYSLILRDVNDRLEAEEHIRELTVEREYLKEELSELRNADQIIGESTALQRVLEDIEQVAPTDSTVLVLGESGTGKELIARAIHNASGRKAKPFIKVNCAAVPAALIESEFFGHIVGAFTGATQNRDGRFLLADEGTIFLDEVGELPFDLQAKLLRVLQEGEFEPVGSSDTIRVNARVVAATNRDLGEEARKGAFREDLYYRLNVFPIEVPPLRDRKDDIGLLAAAFAETIATRIGRPIDGLTPSCIRRLRAYDWPGNIRELQNVIERSVITAQDGRLNLDRALPEVPGTSPSSEAIENQDANAPVRTADEMRDLEGANIQRALDLADGRIAGPGGAAEMLRLPPSTLASRIRALGIGHGKSPA